MLLAKCLEMGAVPLVAVEGILMIGQLAGAMERIWAKAVCFPSVRQLGRWEVWDYRRPRDENWRRR